MTETTFHFEEAVGIGGRTFKYVVLDRIPPPRLVETTCVLRVLDKHPPIGGGCMGCRTGMETSVYVEHTTWDGIWITSVCSECAGKAAAYLGKRGK